MCNAQPVRFFNYGAEQGLSTQWTDFVIRDREGYLWIGMAEGLARYDGVQFRTFHNIPGDTTSLPANRIEDLFVDEGGVLWIGTDGGGLARWNRESEAFTRFPERDQYLSTLPKDLNPRQVWVIHQAPNGMLWIGASTGLSLLDPRTGYREHMPNPYLEELIGGEARRVGVRSLLPDARLTNTLWVGTVSGLFEFNVTSRTFIPRIQDAIRPQYHSNTVRDILQDSSGVLWLGTFAGGLQRFNPETGEYRVLYYHAPNDSVPEAKNRNIIDAVIWGMGNSLWLSTHDKGLVVFNLSTETFSFPRAMDLPQYLLEASADREGNLWISHRSGVIRIPDVIPRNDSWKPRLILSEVKADGMQQEVSGGTELALADRTRNVSFTYSLLSFDRPELIQYQYMLDGYDDDWIDAGNRSFVQYTNLRGGRYGFKVHAVDASGREYALEVPFRIHVPFFRTAWFIALCTAGVILIVGFVFWLRIRQVRREERMKASFEKELAKMEMEALRSQMNPHFLFNALNSLKDLIIRNDPQAASNYLSRFSRLIRLILENSKEQMVSLAQELEAVNLYVEVEQHRFENRFDYRLEVNSGLDPKEVMIPPMLIQPYAENAIWHGLMHKQDKGMLQVSLHQVDGRLVCIVEDNGIGRKKAGELRSKSVGGNKSYGMAITRDRVALVKELYNIEAKVDVEDLMADGEPSGTKVTLSLPLIKSN